MNAEMKRAFSANAETLRALNAGLKSARRRIWSYVKEYIEVENR